MKPFDGLLEWYEPRRRAYPWRRPGLGPYGVLVSEVMLQQTQAARVAPAFERFMARFPSVRDLAAAPVGAVIREWSGLGYNRRAVALSAAARTIVAEHRGRVPRTPAQLGRLPGVGPYTAAAVASLGFAMPVPAIDTNVRRVIARAVLGTEPHAVLPADLSRAAQAAIDPADPGAWNQALMDVGREHCRPVPRCSGCPLMAHCRFDGRGSMGPRAGPSPQPFEGSSRQIRGAVVRALSNGPATPSSLAATTGHPLGKVVSAVQALARDGLISTGPAGRRGKVRLRET